MRASGPVATTLRFHRAEYAISACVLRQRHRRTQGAIEEGGGRADHLRGHPTGQNQGRDQADRDNSPDDPFCGTHVLPLIFARVSAGAGTAGFTRVKITATSPSQARPTAIGSDRCSRPASPSATKPVAIGIRQSKPRSFKITLLKRV